MRPHPVFRRETFFCLKGRLCAVVSGVLNIASWLDR
jgi:hypothetical protein